MKRQFTLLTIMSVGASAQVGLVHVTNCGKQAFPTTACTIPATGVGNLIVVGFQMPGGTSASTTVSRVTDNAGNAYAEAGAARSIDTGAQTVVDIWYAKNSVSGATSLTITPSSTVSNAGAVIWEFSGVDPSAPLDKTAILNSQTASSTPSGASVTTTSASEVIISLAEVANTVTGIYSGNAFTNDSVLMSNGWAHLITTSAGSYAAKWNQSSSGTFASSTVSFKAAVSGGVSSVSACDLNGDGAVNVVDVQLATNMDLGLQPCTANIDGSDVCNPIVVQQVVNAALTGQCTTAGSHTVSLSWTASTTPSVSYNVYRSTVSGGPYTKMNASLVSGTSYVDSTVLAGQTYYYVTTAVNGSNSESSYSNQVTAAIPFP
jgi:hypothetical protein